MRLHVDASFEDFESAPQTTTKKSFKEDAGSFWDDNQGDDWDEKPSAKGKKNDGIDSLLDNIGGLLNIHISDNVHENVKSDREESV